jgi:DNA-binding NarL/FixJ family response regulator
MTKIVYIPNAASHYHIETRLCPAELIHEVAAGRWHPPPEIPVRSGDIENRFCAVRLGREAVLIFRMFDPTDLEELPIKEAPLSRRQLAVLQCLAEGLAVKQISRRLGLAERTVFLHLAALKKKLRVLTTAQAVSRAVELGLCNIQPSNTPDG